MSTAEKSDGYVAHASLAEALSAFQADLPHVGKTKTAQVKSDKGNYSYNYADLADVAKAAHPAMARHGLSFSSKPTLNDEGKFVLAYALRHDSGQSDTGEFPLPSAGTMQAIGASLTYSRRYAFCAITGVVADEDTDGRDSGEVRTESPRRTAQRRSAQNGTRNGQAEPTGDDAATQARMALRSAAGRNEWDPARIAEVFERQHGAPLRTCADAEAITTFTAALVADPAHVLGTDTAPTGGEH